MQLLYNYEEDVADFEAAWRLQEERKHGYRLPKFAVNPEFLYYGDVGALGSQVERVLEVFPREQVKLIFFEDFVHRTADVYRSVIEFLGLLDDGRQNFPNVNASKRYRSESLQRLLRKPPVWAQLGIQTVKRLFRVERLAPIEWVRRMNTARYERIPLRAEFRAELTAYFESEIRKLEKLSGCNLSTWRDHNGRDSSSQDVWYCDPG
jgi:hypothetical protein